MTLTQLRDYCVVVDQGSIRAAAQVLKIGQSTLTRAIQNLESELGSVLLIRSHHGLTLTPAGQIFLTHARALTHGWERAIQDVKNQSAELEGEVAVGVTVEPLAEFVLPVFELFRSRYPKVLVRVASSQTNMLVERVRGGSLDFAICSLPVQASQLDLSIETMYPSSVTVIARRNHPLEKADSIRDLINCEWVVTQPGQIVGGGPNQINSIFATLGIGKPRIAMTTSSLLETLHIVAESDCLAVAPSVLVGLKLFSRSLVRIPIAETFDIRNICLVSRNGSVQTGISQELMQMLTSYSRLYRQSGVGINKVTSP
ncbi:LysR family transcriptional regulator [Paraburkholderia sp. ZP32-5]|uniref:LysR family transcriptional regulator n=1 Tax=Paraburkholderia sp. ZP32-5 TaxID=2883245 RepID=UPI001F3756B6|nr:LysR substrate-binding domain-containing protein [Paraburkholderia sp. ZP32-5]